MTPPKKYMYVNPMGMPIREITRVSVALNANVRVPTAVFLGSTLLVEARIRSTVDEPMRKRMKVPTKQMSRFRRLWETLLLVDNLVRVGLSAVGRYLGRLVLSSALAS
jgi:hypothetical protein